MKLFVQLEKDEKPADEFIMAKAVYDKCKELKLSVETISRMMLLQVENDFSKYMNSPEGDVYCGFSKEV